MALTPTGPNAEQIQYWNAISGPKWVTLHEVIDRQIHPLGQAAMDAAAIGAGDRVLDIGCGCGATTADIARRVGPQGAAVGVDVSAVMLEQARTVARTAGLTQACFEQADAQTHGFAPGSFNVLFSRFGVMFFSDPAAAFANLCQALQPGGRLAFVCWQAITDNPWMLVPLAAAAQHITLPAPPPPGAPSPFAFADAERVRQILVRAGFVDVSITPRVEELTIGAGADLDATVNFLLEMGPTGTALRQAPTEARPAVAGAVRDALRPYATADGVRMNSAAWIVTARRPG
jgi:SAM-dependent methyltransferase